MPVPCQKCRSRDYGYRSCATGFFIRCGGCGYEAQTGRNLDEALIRWNHEMYLIDRENLKVARKDE